MTAQIPLHFLGTPRDVELNGALLEQFLDHITVHAEPANLPAHIDVDVSKLRLGDVLSVADLPRTPGVDFTTSDEIAVAAVHASSVAAEVQATEDALPHGEDAVVEMRSGRRCQQRQRDGHRVCLNSVKSRPGNASPGLPAPHTLRPVQNAALREAGRNLSREPRLQFLHGRRVVHELDPAELVSLLRTPGVRHI